MWLFYLPLAPWVGWLALRHGGLRTITAANPGFPHGGIVGESKADILAKLPAGWVAPFCRIDAGRPAERLAVLADLLEAGWRFPLILKPDQGERGAGVRLVRTRAAAEAWLAATAWPILVQRYHPGPFEAGIFYVRRPDEAFGRVFSITDKHFPSVVGNGRATLAQLVWRHPRYRMQAEVFLERLNGQARRVPAAGERVALAIAGNHCQGTLFRDGAHLCTPALERRIDEIARAAPGFCFGRFDVRYSDPAAFAAGRGFEVIELNGATSESTNVYDPEFSLVRAYVTLGRQWSLLFRIGAANRAAGARVSTCRELLTAIRRHYGRGVPLRSD